MSCASVTAAPSVETCARCVSPAVTCSSSPWHLLWLPSWMCSTDARLRKSYRLRANTLSVCGVSCVHGSEGALLASEKGWGGYILCFFGNLTPGKLVCHLHSHRLGFGWKAHREREHVSALALAFSSLFGINEE